MKKLILTAILILFGFTAAGAFDAVAQLGVGSFCQKGSTPQWVFTAGFEAPIVSLNENGYALKNQTTYVYSDFGVEGVDGASEVYAVKTYLINQRYLHQGARTKVFLGLGTGAWQFTNTSGGDEAAGALMLQFGVEWNLFEFLLEGETIMIPNEPDAHVIGLSVNIGI